MTNKTEKYIEEYLKKHYPKKKRQLRIGSLAFNIIAAIAHDLKSFKELLDELDRSGMFDLFRLPSWHSDMYRKKYGSISQLSRGLSNLEKGGYIRRKGKRTVFLTQKGVLEILKYKMKNKRLEKSWDGKWRIIVFDIEEITRKDRDYLRRQLKWIGFEELQKSVWIFPYEIRDELKEFIKMCKFEFQGDIRFILADHIEPDVLLRKKFSVE